MNELLKLGLTEQEIKNMIELNPTILDLNGTEIVQLFNLLLINHCNERIVRFIVTTNPIYLSRDYVDVNKLLLKLKMLGLTRLDITFESNPWILNYDTFEIDNFIEMKRNEGLCDEDIIDLIDQGVLE